MLHSAGKVWGSTVPAGWAESWAVGKGKHAELNHLKINITGLTAGPGATAWDQPSNTEIHTFSVCNTLGFSPPVHNPWPGKCRIQKEEVTVLKKWISVMQPRIHSKQSLSLGSSVWKQWQWELELHRITPTEYSGLEGTHKDQVQLLREWLEWS